ncbi:MAG: guanitoxin biosynthesis MBL fold metallo-hydrolase GntH [Candidatus Limnocylindrales bacterium]
MIHRTVGPWPRWSRRQRRGIAILILAGALMALAGNATAADEPATGSADVMSNPGASWSTEPIAVFTPDTPLAADHMRITFLGTSFLPRIAQEANSVFVELGNGDSFVFDYGSGVSAKYGAMGIPPSRQTKVFLTHLHGDHTSDLITLYCFGPSQDRKTPLHLYGPSGPTPDEGVAEWGATLKKLMKWHEESFSFLPTGTVDQGDGYDIITHELPYMETGVAYEQNGVTITHFPAVHARDGSVSYRLDWNGLSMVFTGDTRPNEYVLENGNGVDVLIHEMVVPPDVWAEKNSGLQPGDPGWEQALHIATAVQDSSHTPEQALGYILSQTQPRLGVATHFQVNSDTVGPAVDSVQSWWEGPFAIATDLFVIDVSKDAIVLGQATVPEYAWYPPQTPYPSDQLAAPKYDSPTAQLNDELLSKVIDPGIYSDPPQ